MSPRVVIRILRTLLTVIAVGIALFPMLILLDLAGGGTGRGLCPGGITTCRNRLSLGPAMGVVLVVALLGVLAGFRAVTNYERRLSRQKHNLE